MRLERTDNFMNAREYKFGKQSDAVTALLSQKPDAGADRC